MRAPTFSGILRYVMDEGDGSVQGPPPRMRFVPEYCISYSNNHHTISKRRLFMRIIYGRGLLVDIGCADAGDFGFDTMQLTLIRQ